jgi:hypothetical protein
MVHAPSNDKWFTLLSQQFGCLKAAGTVNARLTTPYFILVSIPLMQVAF